MHAASLTLIDPCVAVDIYQRTKDLPGEKRAVSLLQLDSTPVDSALVPTQIQSVKVSSDHAKSLQLRAGSYDDMKMPWYTTSL